MLIIKPFGFNWMDSKKKKQKCVNYLMDCHENMILSNLNGGLLTGFAVFFLPV